MTEVQFALFRRGSDEVERPAQGSVYAEPFQREEDEDVVWLPGYRVRGELVDGRTNLDLEPGPWWIQESAWPNMVRALYRVPESGPVQYDDLVELDPGDLEPVPPGGLGLEPRVAALESHVQIEGILEPGETPAPGIESGTVFLQRV